MTGPDAILADDEDFRTHDQQIDRTVSFRRVALDRDLGRLHAWLGTAHVKPYWQLDLPLPTFRDRLAEKLADDHLTPYVGRLDGVPMSYWECYRAAEDDLAAHYDAHPADRGVHLLVGPEEFLGRGYAKPLLRGAVAMQFRDPATRRVVAEPDARNERVHRVFEGCGFERRDEFHFEAVEKDAVLYVCDRDRFEREVASAVETEVASAVESDDDTAPGREGSR
jgi:RimJ/RimL family protein N-acetyltransferase